MSGCHSFQRYVLLVITVVLVLALTGSADAQAKKKKKYRPKSVAQLNKSDPPCKPNLSSCSDGGCSSDDHHDPNLNKSKNTFALPAASPQDVELQWFKDRPDPQHFQEKGPRDELLGMGEGKYVRTTGHLLIIRQEPGGESCNCGLHSEVDTDNHLDLITDETLRANLFNGTATKDELKAMLERREPESVTVEFTPRVRNHGHPKFLWGNIQPLINKTVQGALLVRITALTLFDFEHFIRNHLTRHNNWEKTPSSNLNTLLPTKPAPQPAPKSGWI